MPRTTTEIADAIMTPKDGYMPRSTMARAKSFVVCSITTKWCAPTTTTTPKRNLSRVQSVTSAEKRSSGPREDPVKLLSRPGRFKPIVQKVPVASRRLPPKPASMPVPSKMTKTRNPLPSPLVPSPDQSLSQKTVVLEPSKIVGRLKEGRLIRGSPASLRVTSTRVKTANEPPPQPGSVPRTSTYRSRVGVVTSSKEKQDLTIKISTTGLRNPGVAARQKVFVNIGPTKAAGCVKVRGTFVEKSTVAGSCRTVASTANRRLTTPRTFAYPCVVEPAFHTASPQPGSPDLSSFPSQSWITILHVDAKGPTQICGSGTLSTMCDMPNSRVAGMTKGSHGCSDHNPNPDLESESESESESVSSCPGLSPSPTIVDTPKSLARPIFGLDGIVKIGTATKEPSNKVSHMVCAAIIISRSGSGTSKAKLMKAMDKCQASLPTKISNTMNKTRIMVRSAVEIAQYYFSPSRHKLHSSAETTTFEPVSADVSRIRQPIIPPLDKNAKVSKNLTTQIEIEMLRAQRRVARDMGVNSRMDCLGSVTKIRTSGLDSPDQV